MCNAYPPKKAQSDTTDFDLAAMCNALSPKKAHKDTTDFDLAAMRITHAPRPYLPSPKPESDYNLLRASSAAPSTLEAKNNALRSLYHGIYHDALVCSHINNKLSGNVTDNAYTRFVKSHRTYRFSHSELDLDQQLPQHTRLARWLALERHRLLK